jgi:putative two-component system response regulator
MQSFRDVDLTSSRILIVDDQEANVRLIEFILDSAGFQHLTHTTDSRRVLELCSAFLPDILLLDLQMPHLDGYAVMAQLSRELPLQEYLPVLVLTADITTEAKQRALASGANDFLSKPLDTTEVILRIKNLLRTRWLQAELRQHNETLEAKVLERTRQLAEAQHEILDRLAIAAEYRDDDTGQHTKRVGKLAAIIASGLGQSENQIEVLRLAATLHDVGKIGVPDRVLMKPDKLTAEEFEIIKSHTNIGAEILGKSRFSILQMAREIAVSHHERWDGTGYPQGLKGEQIPLSGRLVAVADVFDALTHERPYKKAWPLEKAIAEIKAQSGRQFDPHLVNVFLSTVKTEGLQNLASYLEHASDDRHSQLPVLYPMVPVTN